jgi:hypothetical protein
LGQVRILVFFRVGLFGAIMLSARKACVRKMEIGSIAAGIGDGHQLAHGSFPALSLLKALWQFKDGVTGVITGAKPTPIFELG